jgi:predicted permease
METLLQDLRYSVRGLLRSPGVTLVSALTIAIGIGATTVIFSLVNAVLLRPLPVAEPETLATLAEVRSGPSYSVMGQAAVTPDRYLAYREAGASVLSGVAAQRYGEMSLRTGDGARVVSGVQASDNYFSVLGVRPALGRFFSPQEDAGGAAPVAVLGHTLWQREFAGDPAVLGRTVSLDSRVFTVVGVAPPGFTGTFVGVGPEVWVPYVAYERLSPNASAAPGSRPQPRLLMFGRLKPGVSREAAQAALESMARRLPLDEDEEELTRFRLDPLSGVAAEMKVAVGGFLAMLLATAGLVLMIACTNVAGMLIARAAARRRETAIRLALGAGRGRLVRQLVTESVVLFLLGGAAGLVLALWLTKLIAVLESGLPMRVALDVDLDVRVMGFALLVTLATGVIFGLVPAFQASRPDLVPALKSGEGRGGTGRSRLRSGLVVAQLAMSLLLLVTAGLFVRTLRSALDTDLGFNPDGVAVALIGLEPHGYDATRAREFHRLLLDRLEAAPEVRSAALAEFAPMSGNILRADAEVPGRANAEAVSVGYSVVDPGYLETLGIPLVAGRGFTDADREGAAPVAVVNQTMAASLWPGESPVGKTLRMGGSDVEVVGVARDAKYESYRDDKVSYAYLPYAQEGRVATTVLVRARGEAGTALAALRREVRALDPNVALERPSLLTDLLDFSLFPQRMAAAMIGTFGLLGLLLASVGLYGIVAYHVAQRSREIGVRMALGARAADVLRMVVRQGLTLVALGMVIGLVAAFALTRLLSGLLFGVSAADPVTYLGVVLLLGGIALLATYFPARRASRVDPMEALRTE